MKKKYPKLKEPLGKDQKRNTHSINAGLEDAVSLLWEIIDHTTRAMLFVRSKTKRLITIIKIMRSGPHAYNKNSRYDGKDKYKNL